MSSAGSRNTVRLDEVLGKGWVEYWYQPKINLKRRQLVGLETFARVRHPELGVLPAKDMLPGADSAALVELSEQALIAALKTGETLRQAGLADICFSVNMTVDALIRLPIAGLAKKYSAIEAGPKLVFDLGEPEAMAYIPEIHAIEKNLKRRGFHLAIDDFGAAFLASKDVGEKLDHALNIVCGKFRRLAGGRLAEMKLYPALVANCNKSERKRKICENIIRLAHSMGSAAVAIGIENRRDLETLENLRCDVGQGFLLGEPMSEQALLASLQKCAVRREAKKGKAA
jgi:EAL domain-containing protein (putative c-di-GMP-specific phosphodiesterase class I)